MSVLEKGSKSGVGFCPQVPVIEIGGWVGFCPQVPVIEVWFPLIIYFKERFTFYQRITHDHLIKIPF